MKAHCACCKCFSCFAENTLIAIFLIVTSPIWLLSLCFFGLLFGIIYGPLWVIYKLKTGLKIGADNA